MGEAKCFTARMERTGALIYYGRANDPRGGEHLGDVGEMMFDMLASVIETSGFLDIAESDFGLSTAGVIEIDLETTHGPRSFSRDAFEVCPIFWAVEILCMSMIDKAIWGPDAYIAAITDPADTPEPIHLIEAALNLDRRKLPESAEKRYLRAHRIEPPEVRGDDRWLAYRFDDDTNIEYDRSTQDYTLCTRGYRIESMAMTDLVRYFAEANDD